MADRKKQHYVPKFYLKFFSDNGIHINAYLIKDQSIHQNIPYESQVNEKYFYGSDGKMERAFGSLENKVKKILDNIIINNKLPPVRTIERTDLLFFCVLQSARTKLSGELLNENVDLLYKKILSYQIPNYDKHLLFNCSLPANHAVLNVILGFGVVTDDIVCKLLINETSLPFITSDNPVMKYNQYMIRHRHPNPQMGFASKGLQIIYPFSPKLAIIFYDLNVYKIGDRKKGEIIIKNEADIESLNALTIINANEVVFFNSIIHLNRLNEMMCKYMRYRVEGERIRIEELNRERSISEEKIVLQCSKKSTCFYPNFNFIKATDKGKIFSSERMQFRNDRLKNDNYRHFLCEKFLPYPFIEELMK